MASEMNLAEWNRTKIKSVFRFVLKNSYSRFYKNKYKKPGITTDNIKTYKAYGFASFAYKDFQKIPFLTREEIIKTPPLARVFVPKKKIVGWATSSGTSGTPLITPRSTRDQPKYITQLLKEHKVERILNLSPVSNLGYNLVDWNERGRSAGAWVIIGDINNLSFTAQLCKNLEIDCINTSPSVLSFFLPFLKEAYDPSKIKFIYLVGEFISEQTFGWLRQNFKNAYLNFSYGAKEFQFNAGFRCKNLAQSPPRFYHPNLDFFLFEVIDDEIILTTLKPCAFPLMRYKTGDAATIYEKRCPCGSKYILELLGRTGYDFIRISGATIHTEMIEKALSQAGFRGDYELHVFEAIWGRRIMPRLVLDLATKRKTQKLDSLRARIEASFEVGRNVTLKDLVGKKIFLPLEVKFVEAIEQQGKPLKIVSHLR